MIGKEYKDKILQHYRKTMLKTNMVKTSTSSTLIAAGLILIQNGFVTKPLSPWLIGLGVFTVALGFIVNYAGDIHKIQRKEEELDLISEAMRESNERVISALKQDIADHFTREIEEHIYESLAKRLKKKE
ncbi:MAG: hypothetical protein AB7C92_06820 [Synergistaceae bacterium]